MAPTPKELARALYDASARRDPLAIRDLLTEDVVFHQPGHNPLSGDYRGFEATMGLLMALAERSGGTFRTEVHDVLGSDDHAVGLIRISASREGRSVEMPVVHVFHVRDGRLSELWVHPADQQTMDEF